MPIHIDDKTFEDFDAAVEHVKRTKPHIASPEGYVAQIERAQHKAKALLAGIEDYKVESNLRKVKSPLSSQVPFGKENRSIKKIRDDSLDKAVDEGLAISSGTKVRPPKPKQSDRRRIISAKIDEARVKIQLLKLAREEQKISHEHKHSIIFKGAKLGVYRCASLEQQSGKYAKYWLLNAKQTNGNGWGIAQHTARENMKKFIGRPLVVTAQSWHDEPSEYGESYEHPYLPTNDMNQIFAHQNRFKVGNIIDVNEDKNGDWYATIEMMPKFAMKNLPPFCSPAIYQLDASEHEGNISKWEALHLAALNENPAYGARIALLKGTCIGTANSCQIQFKGAKLNDKENDFDRLETLASNGEKITDPKLKELDNNLKKTNKLKRKLAKLKFAGECKYCSNKFRLLDMSPDGDINCPSCGKSFPKKDLSKKASIICPKKLKERLASLGEENMTYQKSKHMKVKKNQKIASEDIENKLRQLGRSVDAQHHQSTWLSTKGDFIGGNDTHYKQIIGLRGSQPIGEQDKIITDFSKENSLPRVQKFDINRAGEKKISIGVHSPINSNQLKSIQELEKGGNQIGYAVGKDYKTAITGEGFRDMVKALREHKFI